jgi:two-component system sensor histidine kinase CpxA
MRMFGNLFLRMFIAFWLMNIAVLGTWLLASNYFDSQPPESTWGDHKKSAAPHRFMLGVIYNLENLDEAGVKQTLDDLYKEHNIQVFLVRRDNTDLLLRAVPDSVAHMVDRLRADRRAMVNSPKSRMAAFRIHRTEDGAISAVFVFPAQRGLILEMLGDSLWLRIALAVSMSGIVCYLLSRFMTSRLKDLQLASRQLANGELDARLQVRERGGDETDELARDFNSMAEQLQTRIQTQKRLMGDVSHELRSPLARLRIALALAQEKPANRPEYMQRIEQEAERLEELIGQLLASQPQGAELDMHVDLVSLLAQLCADANFEGQVAGKSFSFQADTQQAIVDSAGDLLRKSFENILRNALQHTAENSQVRVALSSHDSQFQVVIEDCGPGVPDADLDNIFGEFFRVDTARTRESGGYGLGLAIARRALLEHGGDVFAENTGTGLKITVSLPRHT